MVDLTILKTTSSYLKEIAKGKGNSEFETLILQDLEVIHVGKGIVRCKLQITDSVAGEDGNWHAGFIMAVMDSIGAAAVYSLGGLLHSSVDLSSSFYSTVKIHETVEIEARVNGTNGVLKSALIEIRRDTSRGIIATARLWMAPLSTKAIHNVSSLSKL